MPEQPKYSYKSPKLELKNFPGKGLGLYATEVIQKHELLCTWGGKILAEEELPLASEYQVHHGIQVEDNLYLVPLVEGEAADYVNHSCNPNAGLSGQISMVALRQIQPGEEICFDYAMSDSSDYDEFECQCGAPNCRKKVTGDDWKIPELQKRYKGYFMPYLQRRIDALSI